MIHKFPNFNSVLFCVVLQLLMTCKVNVFELAIFHLLLNRNTFLCSHIPFTTLNDYLTCHWMTVITFPCLKICFVFYLAFSAEQMSAVVMCTHLAGCLWLAGFLKR